MINKLFDAYSSAEAFLSFSRADPSVVRRISSNVKERLDLLRAIQRQKKRLMSAERKGVQEAIEFVQDTTIYSDQWRVMFSIPLTAMANDSVFFNGFNKAEIAEHVLILKERLRGIDNQLKGAKHVSFERAFSLADESVSGLLASNLF
tara:strand:- start:791 stop:1234 length:444 start_codon:yes stop_codon:yes gene_type:complete